MRDQQIGHFFAKYLEEWEALVEGNARPEVEKEIKATTRILHELDDVSSHWALSPDAFNLVWHTDIHSADFEGVRLPYESMIVEYVFDYEALGFDVLAVGEGRDDAPNRFFILTEVDDSRFVLCSGFKLSPKTDPDLPVRWVLSPLCLYIPYTSLENLSSWMTHEEGGFRVDLSSEFCKVLPSMPIFRTPVAEMDDAALRRSTHDMFDEFRMAVGLLAILSCNNAPVREIAPPEKLNRKRAKSGRRQIPTYRTLHVTSHQERSRTATCGTHASPRTHWRRGHIRNQPTAKGIVRKWIRPTIIGAGVPNPPEVVLT